MLLHRESWPAVTIRVFAALNVLMGLVGFGALVDMVATMLMRDPWPQLPPFYAQAFYFRSALNLVFVVLTVLAGCFLWRGHSRGWAICKVAFIGQIVYFFLELLDSPMLMLFGSKAPLVSMALGASAGTGNVGTTLQTITGYPIIGLIGLKVAFTKLRRARAAYVTPTARPSSG